MSGRPFPFQGILRGVDLQKGTVPGFMQPVGHSSDRSIRLEGVRTAEHLLTRTHRTLAGGLFALLEDWMR